MKTHPASSLLNISRILVPCDFSPPAERALVYALRFAEEFEAELTVLHVIEPVTHAPAHCNVADFLEWQEVKKLQLQKKLRDTVEHLTHGIHPADMPQVNYVIAEGEPASAIVETAAGLPTDVIIIATHGHTGMKRFMLGSTTHRVVTHAGCPVLVVREQEHEFVDLPANASPSRRMAGPAAQPV